MNNDDCSRREDILIMIHSGESLASFNFAKRIIQRSEAEEVTTDISHERETNARRRKRKRVKPRVDWQMFAKRARRAPAEILSDTFTFLSIIPHVCFDSVQLESSPFTWRFRKSSLGKYAPLLMHVSLKQGFAVVPSIGSYFFEIFLLRGRDTIRNNMPLLECELSGEKIQSDFKREKYIAVKNSQQ